MPRGVFMKRVVFVLLLGVGFILQAQPVSVMLGASNEITKHYSTSVHLNVQFSDGSVFDEEIFSIEELVAGLKSKEVFDLKDGQSVSHCSFTWQIVKNSADYPGGEVAHPPADLKIPIELDPLLTGDCAVDSRNEIRLTTLPLYYIRAELIVEPKYLKARNATSGVFQLVAETFMAHYEPSPLFTVSADAPVEQVVFVTPFLTKFPLVYKVSAELSSPEGVSKESFTFFAPKIKLGESPSLPLP